MMITEMVLDDIHKVLQVNVVDLERFFVKAPWQKWTVEVGVVIVAHVAYEGTGFEPISWRTDVIAIKDLKLGPRL